MRSAREALMPNLGNLTGKKPERDETVAELKQQIAALQAQIDKMAAERAS
jgi:ABC-type Fe3+-hydroxamate transport system substrate-binding protein